LVIKNKYLKRAYSGDIHNPLRLNR